MPRHRSTAPAACYVARHRAASPLWVVIPRAAWTALSIVSTALTLVTLTGWAG
ncbi:MAG: hypothetical protein HGA44_09540 [Cellulomonadaceae bacterium]|nr:hypothetical protein [Cellulomonadaceae bacterium]